MHAVRQSAPRRRAALGALALAAAVLVAVLLPAGSSAAAATANSQRDVSIRVGHFNNSGHRVLDKSYAVPADAQSGASGTGSMAPATSSGRLPRSLGGGRVAKVARSVPRGRATLSRSGSWWAGSAHYPTPFGCGWVEVSGPTVTASFPGAGSWDVGSSRSQLSYCWGYGVRIVDYPTGSYACPLLTAHKTVLFHHLTYQGSFTQRSRNYYTWAPGWSKSGVYNKTGCRFTGSYNYDESTWIHLYGHSNGNYYWTSN
jgi:hypothetical protein